nr:hypothetical protein [Tanacetum cinerariifolium]
MRDYAAYEQFVALCEQEAEGSRSGPKRRRTYIPRERENAKQRLFDDYFGDDEYLPKYPEENFRRIIRHDCIGRLSIGPILKCTYAINQLEYGIAPDAFDEYLQIVEHTSRQCLKNFTKCIRVLYVTKFLRKPTAVDIQRTYQLHEQKHRLSGMLGSIDCIHWEWKNYPKSLHGRFKRRDHKHRTLMLEAIADQKLWIWHAYFGVSEVNSYLNVLYGTLLFDDELAGTAPECPFVVNGHTNRKGYYLADDIYPA